MWATLPVLVHCTTKKKHSSTQQKKRPTGKTTLLFEDALQPLSLQLTYSSLEGRNSLRCTCQMQSGKLERLYSKLAQPRTTRTKLTISHGAFNLAVTQTIRETFGTDSKSLTDRNLVSCQAVHRQQLHTTLPLSLSHAGFKLAGVRSRLSHNIHRMRRKYHEQT